MTATIQQTIQVLRESLTHYIEATYHISDPVIVRQRKELLEELGVIHQAPYLESTPRYVGSSTYDEIDDLPEPALQILRHLSQDQGEGRVIYPSPYLHQHQALRETLSNSRNLMITTGTGSGKTESFLLPILGKFAIEAREHPTQFKKHHAVRAIILYPMNALVNDQLGRLRTLFGDKRTVKLFEQWAGRPVLFARYTSRTPYAGMRNSNKDRNKLSSIGDFFCEIEDAHNRYLAGSDEDEDRRGSELFSELNKRGKWPAKESVSNWLGKAGTNWSKRAHRKPHDAELITRHEAQLSPPDLLITNYSMLEYMMMRPIERPIFDATKKWLEECPNEKMTIVLDEAHLYRGAQGAEVGLLVRRLRERLGIPVERLQVICATASFSNDGKDYAGLFGEQLSGVPSETFVPITGELADRSPSAMGTHSDAHALAAIDMQKFYSEDETDQMTAILPFVAYRGSTATDDVGSSLYNALKDFAPFNLLVNKTMRAAISLEELPGVVFGSDPEPDLSSKALSNLLAIGSRAKEATGQASLLPCRIHSFFRGLPGLWVCMDDQCPDKEEESESPAGRLYSQPRERCSCGAPVLEYFTCRQCGTSYARGYTNDVGKPRYLWAKEGEKLPTSNGLIEALHPLDLLLEPPLIEANARAAHYDLINGQLNPDILGAKFRTVFLSPQKTSADADNDFPGGAKPGQFAPCACCGQTAGFGKSYVQDHQTKGDQPFQALLGSQLKIQPPGPQASTKFAPLRGRKVLVFSDSRQVAARLAGTLKDYSLRDAVRALFPLGYQMLRADPVFEKLLTLDHAYLAVVLAAHKHGVRLRPELGEGETLVEIEGPSPGPVPSGIDLMQFAQSAPRCPERLMDAIANSTKGSNLGLDLEALAIASLAESPTLSSKFASLPNLPDVAESDAEKIEVIRAWIRSWARRPGIWFKDMPPKWWPDKVTPHKGTFVSMDKVLVTPGAKKIFKKDWLPTLMSSFTETTANGGRRILATKLALQMEGAWLRCSICKSVHRPTAKIKTCIDCGSSEVSAFNPDTDEVYEARRGYYRLPIAAALQSENPQILTIIAAEHTAQLGSSTADKAFSHAENHEMRFQDVDIAWKDNESGEPAVDVLSSTTTMEVGIDIGELSGVALRNMPPGRANYQQRAGRAGRRANAVATVVAFGSADSHDDHYFTKPSDMVRGAVVDPRLTLENPEIARRHIRAYLLQRYHEDRIPGISPNADPNLFSVLGKVGDFKSPGSVLNRLDFEKWLDVNGDELQKSVDRWLPEELSAQDRSVLIEGMKEDTLKAVDDAIEFDPNSGGEDADNKDESADAVGDVDDEADVASADNQTIDPATDKLLDRLLYKGVVPRYAFPTDVVSFHVFNQEQSTAYRNVIDYDPSQGLTLALSQYAPNKQLWINGKQYTSKAIYSPYPSDRRDAWGKRRLYFECNVCSHAKTEDYNPQREKTTEDCPACKSPASFGPARRWMRPVGFAHPIDTPAETQPDAPPETARATRAKLYMQTPKPDTGWINVTERVRAFEAREFLLVSNTGVDKEGYDYCLACGRIESSAAPEEFLNQPHYRPFRSDEDGQCPGNAAARNVVLGTDFKTDIALFSLPLSDPFRLAPGNIETESALRTLCEALTKAACETLDIEPGEVLAEFRPALTEAGATGQEVEVFLYDTLAGGAGFSSLLVHRAKELFDRAKEILSSCPGKCDSSCYRCLQSFRNRMEHGLLDRKLGIQLIEHALYGDYPEYPNDRVTRSLDLLTEDLRRQFGHEFDFERNVGRKDPIAGSLVVPIIAKRRSSGKETWIALSSPLAHDVATDERLRHLSADNKTRLQCVNDLVVRRHLPEAALSLHGSFS